MSQGQNCTFGCLISKYISWKNS